MASRAAFLLMIQINGAGIQTPVRFVDRTGGIAGGFQAREGGGFLHHPLAEALSAGLVEALFCILHFAGVLQQVVMESAATDLHIIAAKADIA